MMIACGCELPAEQIVLRPAVFIRQFGNLPAGDHSGQGAAVLHAKLIGRDMFGPPLQHLVHRPFQHSQVHPRHAGNQVDAAVKLPMLARGKRLPLANL